MPDIVTKPAGVYCRISDDPQGRRVGVDRQELVCRELAAARGWSSVEVYVDNDVSAFSGVVRPAYHRMLDDLQLGRLQAVVSWDADRLHRSTRELEDFMDMAIAAGVAIVTVTAGDINLASAEGRLQTRIKGTISRYESEHKTERTRAGMASLAQAGRWKGGPRPYGYDVDRDNHGRPLRDGRLVIIEAEAAIIREAAARVLAGDKLFTICKQLNLRGVPTAQGTKWRTQTMRRILTNPTTVGQREHKGHIVADALWPGVLAHADWEQLRALLLPTRPGTRTTWTGHRLYLLTGGIAVCGACGSNLHAHSRHPGVRSYNCISGPDKEGCGGVTASAKALDTFVAAAVLTRQPPRRAPQPDPTEPTRSATRQEDAARAASVVLQDPAMELAQLFARGCLTAPAWNIVKLGLTCTEAEHQPCAEQPMHLHPAVLAAWTQMPLQERRQRVTNTLERVVVNPTRQRGGSFDSDRVHLIWR